MDAPAPLPLPPGEVHVWYAFSPGPLEPALADRFRAPLADEERRRERRFGQEKDRRLCLLGRFLRRATLSRYVAVPPAAWSFATGAHGKPAVTAPAGAAWLRFNLSHTHGLLALAVARDREVGVDVEDTERGGALLNVAERFFAPAEVAHLRATPPAEQMSRFFDFWTLKEAYIKACGKGLAISLQAFAFTLEPGRPPRVTCAPELADDPDRWSFAQFDPSPRHRLAVAVRREAGDAGPAFRFREVDPQTLL